MVLAGHPGMACEATNAMKSENRSIIEAVCHKALFRSFFFFFFFLEVHTSINWTREECAGDDCDVQGRVFKKTRKMTDQRFFCSVELRIMKFYKHGCCLNIAATDEDRRGENVRCADNAGVSHDNVDVNRSVEF